MLKNLEYKDSIDHDKWSRQIRAYGIKITQILSNLKILIIGLRGYGVEIAKNIILSNPNRVSIFDDNICKINDLGSNYFLTDDDVKKKKRRDEACITKLMGLNPSTKIVIENNYISNIKHYDIIVITEIMKSEIIYEINKECHENNKGFIYTLSLGLMGFVFSDFGPKHLIIDKTGIEKGKFYISSITKEKNGKITIDFNNTNKRLNQKGYLLFKQVEGMVELNSTEPRYYNVNPEKSNEFFIGDTSNYSEYIGGGIAEEFIYPLEMKYKTLKENIMNPTDNMMKFDYSENKKGRKQLLHTILINIINYYDKNGKLPELNNEEEADNICNQIFDFIEKNKDKEFFKDLPDKLEKDLIKNLIKFSKAQHPSLCSFLGGFAAQEVIKFTGLYCPLNQCFWIDIYEETIINLQNPDRTILNCRYDDLISIYGREFMEKLHNLNIFLVGAGAVGCEYLKILSLMGIATKNNCIVTVTDNDCIENSNLNRQFLFRKEHVGKSKSLVACEEVKKINPEFNCQNLQVEVREENESIFDEKFYKEQDFVLIAVDNVKARNYLNEQCIYNRIKLIECGTLGENASSQLIIPFVSAEYKGVENNNNQVGVCTIRNLPSLIEHCIEWSKIKFEEYFTKNIKILKNFIENPKEFLENNTNNNSYEKLIYLKEYINIFKSKSFDECLKLGKKLFYLNFIKNIEDILIINPPDKLLKDGSKFWKGSNRLPHIIEFNIKEDINYLYVEYFSYLLANSLGIPINTDINYKKQFLKLSKIDENDELYNSAESNLERQKVKIEKIKSELMGICSDKIKKEEINKIQEQIFEKDENNQIDFLYISSNLRALNFNIDFCTRDKVKFVSGNIVPSIPTTTSSIVGFISTQIYTLLQTTDLKNLRQINIDLSTPFFLILRPKKPFQQKDIVDPETKIITKAIPPRFTCWDILEVKGNKTTGEVLDFISETYQVDVTGLYSLNNQSIIRDETSFNLPFEDAYNLAIGKEKLNKKSANIFFKVTADLVDSDNHANMPKFKYILI